MAVHFPWARFRSSCEAALALILTIAALTLPVAAQAQALPDQDAAYERYGPLNGSMRGNPNGQTSAPASVHSATTNDRFQADEIQSPGRKTAEDRERSEADERDDVVGRSQRPTWPSTVRPLSEFETYVSKIADKPLRRFGENLLVPEARGFATPPTATVPLDYRLNPGDELMVGLTGSIQASDLQLTVDSEGRIFIPRIGAVTVGGVRYGDVQAVVARQVARVYRDFRVAVSIGQLHGITVYVTGFAARPGSYTVNSLSTLVDAVLAAGGPSAGGSFRSIQVRRAGQLLADFDLYDLLLKGQKSGDVVLQNGDVITIAPVGAQVAVIGSVNNQAIFEVRPGDTLTSVLEYAGGGNTVADQSRLLVLNPFHANLAGWEQLSPSQAAIRTAQRGEILRVLSGIGIARPLGQQPTLVTISGEVAKPGRYYLPAGTPMAEVISRAGGLTPQAFPFATVFTRESVRSEQRLSYERALRDIEFLLTVYPLTSSNRAEQLQPARLQAVQSAVEQLRARRPEGRVVLDLDPGATGLPGDLVLENNDSIYVPPTPTTVGVFGSVPSPSSFRYEANMTIGQYLARAGGVQRLGDRSQIFVVRASGTVLAAKRGLLGSGLLGRRALPGDLVFVPMANSRDSIWTKIGNLTSALLQGALIGSAINTAVR